MTEKENHFIHYLKINTRKDKLTPFLFSSFYVDLFDFHSNIKISKKFLISVPLIEVDNEITWTKDMFTVENAEEIVPLNSKENIPLEKLKISSEKLGYLKDILFNSIIKFFKIRLYKNKSISVFSELDESKEEFIKRCFKLSKEKYEDELKQLKRTSEMKFEQLKEKFDRKEYINELEKEKVKDSFYEAKWALQKIFINHEANLNVEIPLSNEASQDLTSLLNSILKDMKNILSKIKENAEDVEKYYIHLTPKNISDFNVGILWK